MYGSFLFQSVKYPGGHTAAKQRDQNAPGQIRRVVHPEIEPGQSDENCVEKRRDPPAVFGKEQTPEQCERRCGMAGGEGGAAGDRPDPFQTRNHQKRPWFLHEVLQGGGEDQGQCQSGDQAPAQGSGAAKEQQDQQQGSRQPDGVRQQEHDLVELRGAQGLEPEQNPAVHCRDRSFP